MKTTDTLSLRKACIQVVVILGISVVGAATLAALRGSDSNDRSFTAELVLPERDRGWSGTAEP